MGYACYDFLTNCFVFTPSQPLNFPSSPPVSPSLPQSSPANRQSGAPQSDLFASPQKTHTSCVTTARLKGLVCIHGFSFAAMFTAVIPDPVSDWPD